MADMTSLDFSFRLCTRGGGSEDSSACNGESQAGQQASSPERDYAVTPVRAQKEILC